MAWYTSPADALQAVFAPKEEKKDSPNTEQVQKKAPRVSIPTGLTSASFNMPYAVQPFSREEFEELANRETLGLREQTQGYRALADKIADLRAEAQTKSYQPDLSNLLLASDIWNKTNMSKLYKKPLSKQERLDQILGLEASLNKLAAGLVGSEMDVLKSQFQPYRSGSISMSSKGAGGGRGKMLTAPEQRQLSDLKNQIKQMENLKSDWSRLIKPPEGIGEVVMQKLSGFNPFSDEREFDRIREIYAQGIAKAMEGSRMSDRDIKRYKQMVPELGDPENVALAKLNAITQMMQTKHDQNLETFRRGGFNMSGFSPAQRTVFTPSQKKPEPEAPTKKAAPKKKAKPKLPSLKDYEAKRLKEMGF